MVTKEDTGQHHSAQMLWTEIAIYINIIDVKFAYFMNPFGRHIKISIIYTCPGMTLLALGHVDISPTVHTSEPERDSTSHC